MQEAPYVDLGGRTFVVRPVSLSRIRQIKQVIPNLAKILANATPDKPEQMIDVVLDAGLQFPFEFLSIFLPDLTPETVESATIPEIIEAFQVVAKANRLDALKNALGPLTQTVSLRSTSSSN